MNDSLTGQLTSQWMIPPFARDRLWLDSNGGSARCEGPHGDFQLEFPAHVLTLRWNGDDGIPLAQLAWQIDNLGWDGAVRLGGLVESVHLTHLPDVDYPLGVVAFSGQPLRAQTKPYPDAPLRDRTQFDVPDYLAGVDDSIPPMTATLITFADSPLVGIAQDALTQKYPLHVYGSLDDKGAGWDDYFALPIVWEAVTVFAP